MNPQAEVRDAELAQEIPHLLWDSARSWTYGEAQQRREEAAVFLLIEHAVWPAKLAEARALRLEGPNGEHLDDDLLGKTPAEDVWTSVNWERVSELLTMDEPLVYATTSEWAVLGFAASLVESSWSEKLGSVDDGNMRLMHATLAWARGGERASDPFLS